MTPPALYHVQIWWACYWLSSAKSLQSCPTLCDPIDGSPPGSPVPEILQARTLEWVAISFSNTWKWKVKVKSLSRVWLSDPMDCSPPGSSAHGIFQARVLEWGAIACSETCVYLSSKVIQTIVFICKKSYLLSDPSIMMQKFLFELHIRTRLVIFTCSRCCWARNSDLTLYELVSINNYGP